MELYIIKQILLQKNKKIYVIHVKGLPLITKDPVAGLFLKLYILKKCRFTTNN